MMSDTRNSKGEVRRQIARVRKKTLVDEFLSGRSFEDIARHYGLTQFAVEDIVRRFKKEKVAK